MKAVFLDRDNTLIEDKGFVHKVEDLKILPGVIEGLQRLQEAGYTLFLLTNQSGIGRGLFPLGDYELFMSKFIDELSSHGIFIEEIYCCPHKPEDECACRKPKPYLIELAMNDYPIDPKESWMVGDRLADYECGLNAGLNSILVGEGRTFLDVVEIIQNGDVLDEYEKGQGPTDV
jgi:histidinol-phosphate phosphatase family protein